MKHLQCSALLLLTILCVPIVGHSASFDCAKAMSEVERTVCSDAELSKLDDSLEAAYRAASATADARTQLTRDQRRWLGIRNACRDSICIKSAYEARIVELRAMESAQRAAVARGNAEAEEADGVCAYVARMANLGKLEDIVLKSRPWKDSSFPTPADLGSVGVTFRNRVDINNDGRPEYVFVTSEGTAHFEGIAAYDADMRPIEFATSPEVDWELNMGNTDPIMEAVDYGYVAKLEIIIKAGIRPEQRHLDLARRASKPNPEIIQMLESALSR